MSESAGPSVLSGDVQWALVADIARDADAGRIRVFTTPDAMTEWWLARYPERATPEAPIVGAVFVAFNIIVPRGCPDAVLNDIVLDLPGRLLYGEFARDAHGVASCGDVAAGHLFLVAIRRQDLPSGQVRFRLEKEFYVCADCGRELEQVEVDL